MIKIKIFKIFILAEKREALIIPTICLSGKQQMSLDLYFLDQTISNKNILFTLRFYLWIGNWISIGFHQKKLPYHWIDLKEKGIINIVRRPSGGGAVLHSGGITYAITFKKPEYKKFSYQIVNQWLVKSFSKLGIELHSGNIKKSEIKDNCFSSAFTSDLIDQDGFKRIGSAQYWKKGSFLQHGEIQLNPPKDLWLQLFKEKSPPPINNFNRYEIIDFLQNSFLENHKSINLEKIFLTSDSLLEKIN